MSSRLAILTLAASLSAFASATASAHAFLERAVPGVGATVNGSPNELRLRFTQNVVVALSGVRLAAVEGPSVPASKPTGEAGNPAILHVRLGRALRPGTYVVTWHVVSIDTHPTSGSYKFTVAP